VKGRAPLTAAKKEKTAIMTGAEFWGTAVLASLACLVVIVLAELLDGRKWRIVRVV
jgi:hypothetical protein